MEKLQCEICGKVIEGYNPNHVEYLLRQHDLSHEYRDSIVEELNKKKKLKELKKLKSK